MVVAVTEDVSAPPMPNVPALEADHVPKWLLAVAPEVVNVGEPEFVLVPPEAAFHAARLTGVAAAGRLVGAGRGRWTPCAATCGSPGSSGCPRRRSR
jgi:hypothetical protein